MANFNIKLSNILYHWQLSMASFRFCETCLLHIEPFVVITSAIFPFLGGTNAIIEVSRTVSSQRYSLYRPKVHHVVLSECHERYHLSITNCIISMSPTISSQTPSRCFIWMSRTLSLKYHELYHSIMRMSRMLSSKYHVLYNSVIRILLQHAATQAKHESESCRHVKE